MFAIEVYIMKKSSFLFSVGGLVIMVMFAFNALHAQQPETFDYQASLTVDYFERLAIPQTDVPHADWYTKYPADGWGPMPVQYPGIEKTVAKLPAGVDIKQWKRDRVVALAKKYIGLPYRHHHIPGWSPQVEGQPEKSGPGLDCSNFTSWIYNFGFGIMLSSDVVKQSQAEARQGFSLPASVQKIEAAGKFLPGDLLFILQDDRSAVSHVVIFIDDDHIIDSTDGKVDIRDFKGWYKTHLSHGLRIFS